MPTPYSNPERKDTREDNVAGFIKDQYLSFLQEFFAQLPQGQFRYTGSDTPESELDIRDYAGNHLTVIDKRPAIIMQRGPLAWARVGLDQMKDMNIRKGSRRHSDLISGTMTLNCISRAGLEAERLASQVLYALKFYRRELQRRGLFDMGQEAQMGAESPPGALVGGEVDPHTILVPVYSPFYIQVGWEVTPAKEIPLKGVTVQLASQHISRGRRIGGTSVISLDDVSQEVRIRGTN